MQAMSLGSSSATMRWGALVPGTLLLAAGWLVLASGQAHDTVAGFAPMWLAMAVAMMIPTVYRPMMRAADGSPARAWAFAAGFIGVWLVAGVPAFILMNALQWTPFWIAMAWFVAGAYQVTPVMQRQLSSCRSVRHGSGATSYGARQGLRCVASCWPVMLAVMVTAMTLPGAVLPLLALVAATVLLCWEKRPGVSSRAIASVGLAMLLVAAGGYVLLGGGPAAHHHSTGTSTS